MANLLKLSFWFDVKPLPLIPIYLWVLLIGCVTILILGIVFSLLKVTRFKNKLLARKILTKLSSWCTSFGIVGLILIFFKQQMVLYLGMRLWFALWLLSYFVWLVFILKYIIIGVPKIKKERERKKEFEKYLP